MGRLKSWGLDAPVYVTFQDTSAAGLQLDQYIFVADDYYVVQEARLCYRVAGGANAAVDIKKVPSATVLGSGVSVLLTAFDLTAAAATAQKRTDLAATLTATVANKMLIAGDSLALDYSGTLTGLLGLGGTIVLRRYRKTKIR